jgi:hypothetical protein
MSIEQLILFCVVLALVTVIFFVSGAIVGNDWTASGSYMLRVLVVAIVAVVAIPVLRSAANEFDLGDLGLLLAFVILIITVRYIMIEELIVSEEWLAAIAVSLVGVVLIYIVDAVAGLISNVRILSLF